MERLKVCGCPDRTEETAWIMQITPARVLFPIRDQIPSFLFLLSFISQSIGKLSVLLYLVSTMQLLDHLLCECTIVIISWKLCWLLHFNGNRDECTGHAVPLLNYEDVDVVLCVYGMSWDETESELVSVAGDLWPNGSLTGNNSKYHVMKAEGFAPTSGAFAAEFRD